MEIEAEASGSEANRCEENVGLDDKQKKRKRNGKKRKPKKPENELENVGKDSQKNGNVDEAGSSKDIKEMDKSISEGPEATPQPKDSVPDANGNGGGRRKSKRLENIKKKKEDSLLEEKTLDDVVKATKEAQESCEKPGDAQLCTGLGLLTQEDSQGRKKKKERKRNTKKESGVAVDSSNAQVAAPCSIVSEPEGSKPVNIEEKTGAGVVITSCLESKEDTGEQLMGTDVEINETVSQTQSPKAKKKRKRRSNGKLVSDPLGNTLVSKIEDSTTEKDASQNVENTKKKKKNKKKKVDQDALGDDGINNVEAKTTEDSGAEKGTLQNVENTKQKKKDKNKKDDHDGLGAEGVSNVEGKTTEDSVTEKDVSQNVENAKKKKKDKKKKVDQDTLGVEGISNAEAKTSEDSATEGKSNQNVKKAKRKKNGKKVKEEDALDSEGVRKVEEESVGNDKITKKMVEVGEVALEAGVSKVEVETKKKKKKKKSKKKESSLDHKPDSVEEKDAVSVPRNDEEVDVNKENLETSLSSTVLINDNVAHGLAPPEIVDVPTCSCASRRHTKKLVVFDLNGILADIVVGPIGELIPDGRVSNRSVFLRPFVHSFLEFCFERFNVGIWSSRRIGLDYMTNLVMKNLASKLWFCLGQDQCITTRYKTLDNHAKPLFLKSLKRVWKRFGTCFTCKKRMYNETNTLIVDDSPEKSLCNPPYTGIFPRPYKYSDREDSELGPEGELRKYLERLADATSVQKFVAENPYGQAAITETHESWEFYSKIVKAYCN